MQSDVSNPNINLLVTGQRGFVGTHLTRMVTTQQPWAGTVTLAARAEFDLLDPQSLERMIGDDVPDAVIHLAGQTAVPAAIANPAETLQVNLIGTLNLLQTLKKRGFAGSFLYVSSGDVYGAVAEADLPIDENQPPQPRNPYAVSKIAAEALCQQWSRVEPWRIVIARPFNHIGPGQRADFVISEVARQIVRIKRGLQPARLELGDVDVSRDFLAVEDVIGAYMALLRSGRNGEIYNVCSGREFVIRELIEQMLALAGISASIERDSRRFRPADQRRVVGDNAKLRGATGWQPRISLNDSLQSILQDWEQREAND